MSAIFRSVRCLGITVPWVVHLFVIDTLLSLLLPVSYFFPNWAYDVSSRLASTVWHSIQIIFTRLNGARITSSGAELPRLESAIIVANHVSWTDFYMIQHLAIKAGMLSRSRYFAKKQLQWVPFLGWGLWAMGFPLVTRNWMKDRGELNRVFARITRNKWPIWLVSYSEATRYTSKKYEEARIWCKEHDKPIPKHTLQPRTKGFVTTVQHLRKTSHVRAVYDVTIAYSNNNKFLEAPTIWESLSEYPLSAPEGGRKFHVHMERFPLKTLPQTDAGLAEWLENRWVIKGKVLEEIRRKWADGEDIQGEIMAN